MIENNVCIFDDFMPPSISIREPQGNQIFNSTSPSFNVYIVERLSTGIDAQWYTINNGTTHYAFNLINYDTGVDSYGEYLDGDGIGVINEAAWNSLDNGHITIRFYANDTLGNLAYQEVIVIKSFPSQPIIPGYNIFLLIGAMSALLIIIIRKQKQK